MDEAAARALSHWALTVEQINAPIRRENIVYPVRTADALFALRLHRPGYRTEANLRSELDWMAMLAAAGMQVPAPLATSGGSLLADVDGAFASVLTWMPGRAMGATGTPLKLSDRLGVLTKLGAGMARLHTLSDAWTPPADFCRPAWDKEGLVGAEPLWGRFWEASFVDDQTRILLMEFRDCADAWLEGHDSLDYGLIHADLVRENVLVDAGKIAMIDFDDGGPGFRLFDVATVLGKNAEEPDYPDLKAALLNGYRRVRSLDNDGLDLFLALRACTYLGWIAERWDEPGSPERAKRNLVQAVRPVRAFMDRQ